MPIFQLNINGKEYKADVAGDTPILWVLRDHLGLVGTKFGCGIAQCGACTVLVDGVAARSCVLPVSKIRASKIITIEGLSAALLKQNPKPSDQEIEDTMHENLCRCGAYHRIREAVKLASTKISKH
jgi:isoquinoline 1-oxidoreductase alpha subunit